MQILYHFPEVVHRSFKPQYDYIEWRNNEEEFQRWCRGETGYPIVDAGMRQLNTTGFMHNRVRMIVASFYANIFLSIGAGVKLTLRKNFWTMIWLPITVTGNGRQVVAAMQLLTSGFSIQRLKLRNLIKTCSILKNGTRIFSKI